MKGSPMTTDWRTVQMFLDDEGVFEVEADADDYSKMRCTCPAFRSSKKCKHARLVRRRIEENGGTYSIQIPETVPDAYIMEAMQDPIMFRNLIINHAKIEVVK